jgi:transposase, IS30 family
MKKYKHLTQVERTLISHYHDNGISIGEMGRRLGRNKSTIWREIRRNSNKDAYRPDTARRRYLSRRKKARRIDRDASLKAYILERFHEGFTPELIALRLKTYGELEEISYISHESIYQWLYQPAQKKEKLYKFLPCCHARRGRRKRVHRGRIPDRTSIHDRPEIVEARKEVGHWEADLMSFRGNSQHMLVVHERVTRYTVAIKLASKTASETIAALLCFFKSLPDSLLKSVTFDNGMEFAKHKEITQQLGVPTYFCDVYSSWQKGGIENMNGRFRRDLPRKTDLLNMPEEELEQIVLGHNLMPRKVLNGKSPLESLANHLNRTIVFLFKKGVALHP